MKAIIGARVSTDEQKENSPDAQLYRMETYCKNRNFAIDKDNKFNFVESAYKTKRDEFDKLIERIESYIAKKEKVAVCFDKVDRLSRNIFDKRVAWLYERAINDEIELHFVSDNQVINNAMNAGDKFAFGMKLGLSKYYSDAISDNVKRSFELKRKKGEWIGKVRLGYLNVALDEGKRLRKDIILDPSREHLVRKIFEMYATDNHSYEAIRVQLTAEGLRSLEGRILSKSNIENIIKDPFYYGQPFSKKYGLYESYHPYPKLISKELWDKCQEIRTKRKGSPYKTLSRDFIFKGLLKCPDCGCSISFEYKKKKSGKDWIGGACTNSRGFHDKKSYVNEKVLLEPVYAVLERFEGISEDVCKELVEELRKTTEAEVTYHKAQVTRIRKDHDEIKAKDDRLLEALLDTSITKDVYDKKHQEYADKLQLLHLELNDHMNADYEYQTTVATVLSVAKRAKTIFEGCSEPAQKRAFLNYLLQNPTVSEKKLVFSIASPFNLILQLADSPTWLRDQGSNLGHPP